MKKKYIISTLELAESKRNFSTFQNRIFYFVLNCINDKIKELETFNATNFIYSFEKEKTINEISVNIDLKTFNEKISRVKSQLLDLAGIAVIDLGTSEEYIYPLFSKFSVKTTTATINPEFVEFYKNSIKNNKAKFFIFNDIMKLKSVYSQRLYERLYSNTNYKLTLKADKLKKMFGLDKSGDVNTKIKTATEELKGIGFVVSFTPILASQQGRGRKSIEKYEIDWQNTALNEHETKEIKETDPDQIFIDNVNKFEVSDSLKIAFISFWLEKDFYGKRRYEKEKYFNFERRLKNFWRIQDKTTQYNAKNKHKEKSRISPELAAFMIQK